MGHLHMRRQRLQSTKDKPPDTDLEEKIKTNVVYCTTVDPSTTKKDRIYSDICGHFLTTSSWGNRYIHVMYVYDFNSILTTEINNSSEKETIRDFKSLTEELKIRGINPGFHFMDNQESTALKMTMTTMNIKYQLVPPRNHRANNSDREIQTFKNHLIAELCSVDRKFHIQLWYILLQQAKISLNLIRQSRTLTHISLYNHIFR